ncbi:MAG: serine/threonine-protein phosphatase [Microcystis panniformis Mp_MB_F_20051200_S9]|uniref:Serine/threonine-protein phosphatase n=1 Tax=Microcystis panniformis Mp_MB_F_20051200_S9 TaxID=2486223 RepID=A0A552PTW6_9CHRO|nr:MAG: serine/threonine-protein phosphatase [Microcystis panniformis Mp_GB_SS_20050300_S99D]TRV52275.1 MAG: serine/threonine-protein phosphatase [Microcystis panniformis Mp_MB_F_20080800_S26D]TRV54110.1 MAG: serine/threonine-protein phosphatase [Microcystis panniformis Mp_GB_SS_20050300_S99]TRV59324.1 MAG: serine/threonine-protein phosphatase [Microcystis panniformis Mp_MB_F_20080800_S26]TRV60438.1 MAG: serine/threonine-protein phosphatase [Microcystis panniformis Mp_MB_F_20051200_S9]TRV60628
MDSLTTLQCQNLTCLSSNALTNRFCEKCGTPLVKRYLWMMGDWVRTYYRVGELIDNRYLVKQPQIVLDTKPAQAPQAPEEPPSWLSLYLKLLPFHLHIPQVYGYIPSPDERLNMDIWLLEYGTIPLDQTGELIYPELLPTLAEVWWQASDLRQIHWLWQMAKLWHPLQKKAVVSSLLNPFLTRVNNQLLQLLELSKDEATAPNLKDLGAFWASLIPTAAANIQDFLVSLTEELESGDLDRPESLITILDYALQHYGAGQERSYEIFTCTDTGPLREHNEDGCYPPANQAITLSNGQNPLAIVCDGIGGQEGGEIAAQLAIETLPREINRSPTSDIEVYPDSYSLVLEQAIRVTNDLISQRNDQELRQDRQRMGTTLVMAFAHAEEMYVAHVGDSRIYWITPQGCHQVTVDDDLASREVKLGYLLYRDAVQYPNAGALVQALGMSGANNLHPTVQRLIVDQDCVFLLCSDGLSDYDRVEQYWDSEILPLLRGEKTVTAVGESLLQLANQKNGHDNSTIALVYCRVVPAAETVRPLVYAEVKERIIPHLNDQDFDYSGDTDPGEEVVTAIPTPPPASSSVSSRTFPPALTRVSPPRVAIAVGVLGLLAAIAWQFLSPHPASNPSISPTPVTGPTPTTGTTPLAPSPTPVTGPSPTTGTTPLAPSPTPVTGPSPTTGTTPPAPVTSPTPPNP